MELRVIFSHVSAGSGTVTPEQLEGMRSTSRRVNAELEGAPALASCFLPGLLGQTPCSIFKAYT